MTATGNPEAVAAVRRRLDGRRLIWFGIRGEDGEALVSLPELQASFSLTARMKADLAPLSTNVVFEELTGTRPDLDDPELDVETGEAAEEYRRRLLDAASTPCVLVTYRATNLTSELAFAAASTVTVAGLLSQRHVAFDDKPWVDAALTAAGVRGLGWTYCSWERREQAKRLVASRPHVLRANRTSGGVGISLLRSEEDVESSWPTGESFVGLAPYLEAAVPINLSGCVFVDGSVRLHPPSVQLIGIPSCTHRPFGYCGNDFGGVADLPSSVLEELDEVGRAVGGWLFSERYRGVFGIDALAYEDHVYFTEINPRFQGSSRLSAKIADLLGVPNLFLEHLMGMLGLTPADEAVPMAVWANEQPPISQIVVHNTSKTRVALAGSPQWLATDGFNVTQVPIGLSVDPGGTLARLEVPSTVTETGYDLDDRTKSAVAAVSCSYDVPVAVSSR